MNLHILIEGGSLPETRRWPGMPSHEAGAAAGREGAPILWHPVSTAPVSIVWDGWVPGQPSWSGNAADFDRVKRTIRVGGIDAEPQASSPGSA